MKEKLVPKVVPFWQAASLDDLLAQQRPEPVYSLDELSALWPGEEDPEEVLSFILAEREARRRTESKLR